MNHGLYENEAQVRLLLPEVAAALPQELGILVVSWGLPFRHNWEALSQAKSRLS